MTKEKSPEKKYATAGNPTINAVVKSLYRFASEQQALDRLNQLKEYFVISKQSPAGDSPETAIIWIRGYALTDEEVGQGYTGNYAIISCKPIGDSRFTLQAVKVESELRYHPQRKRPKRRHPDWGHPILRSIKKKRVFESLEEADAELLRLHEEFPEVSIPDTHRLLIIIYEKLPGVKSPVQKYKFEIKAIPEGGFFINAIHNNKPARSQAPPGRAPSANDGYFTSMVKLKRKKKKPIKPSEKPSE